MLASLKALKLIGDEKQPTELFKSLVRDKGNYQANLRLVLESAYPYLFDGSIDLSNTTTEMVVDKFKEAGASGSTIAKGMSFFISAAKEAGIAVSARVKPPQAPKSPASKRGTNKPKDDQDKDGQANNREEEPPPEGTEKISFTLRGMPDVVVYFPEGLESDDEIKRVIKATIFNLEMYYGVQMDKDAT